MTIEREINELMAPSPRLGMLGNITSFSALSANKHSLVVIRAREIVSLNASYKTTKTVEAKERCGALFNALLGFLVSQFRDSISTDEVRNVLSNSDLDPLNEDVILGLPEGVVPVAIVRSLMRNHHLQVDVRALSNWEPFQEKFQRQVLYA